MWRNAGRYRPRRRQHPSVHNEPPHRSEEDRVDESDSSSAEVNSDIEISAETPEFPAENSDIEIPAETPEFPEVNSAIEIPAETIKITRRTRAMGNLCVDPVQRCNDETYDVSKCRNVASLQSLWQSHSLTSAKVYPVALWRILGAVLGESKTTQTKVLKAVAAILSAEEGKKWPLSRRALDAKVLQSTGTILPRLLRAVQIDLSDLSSKFKILQNPICFEFVDPVIAWALCASNLSKKHELFFNYKSLHHPLNGELLYGASMQNGMMMKRACERLPTCPESDLPTGPALFGVSWDAGNASKRRSYTPILISVGNTDYCGADACFCIAYLPKLPLTPGQLGTDVGKQARHELTQKCIGAILQVIEQSAANGFKCTLRTGSDNYHDINHDTLPRYKSRHNIHDNYHDINHDTLSRCKSRHNITIIFTISLTTYCTHDITQWVRQPVGSVSRTSENGVGY